MTEQTLPAGGTAVAEPPAPLLPPGLEDTGEPDNRRKLLLVGGGVGLLVLLIAAFFLLKGGGSPGAQSGLVPSAHHPHPAAAAPAASSAKPVKLPKQFHGVVGRDPFKPLVVAAAAPAAGTTGSTTTTTGTTGATTATTTGTTSGTTGTTATSTPTYQPVWLELKSVYGTKWANFVVGYSNGRTLKTVSYIHVLAPTSASRTTFANVFALLAIHGGEATVQFGDGTPIDVAPGAANRLVVS